MTVNREPCEYVYKDSCQVNIDALKWNYCCGCGACANVCSYGAINMIHDSMGFRVPQIDYDKCVKCGKCRSACPVMNPSYKNTKLPHCYAAMANDDVRRESTAGGVFSVLADYVLDKGGCVCGAELTDNLATRHVIIDSKSDIGCLRGAKYVQSDTDMVYSEIKDLLEKGRYVLFTSCPCQVAGLYGVLEEKNYDRLITMDFACHGMPPQKVFDKYIEDVYGRENVDSFSFRTKKYGYSCFNQEAHMKDGTNIPSNFRADSFEKVMHRRYSLKDICGDCPFAELPRQGDFTCGDLFSAKRFGDECSDGLGTSFLLANNDRAQKILDEISDCFKLCKKIDFEKVRNRNRFVRVMNVPKNRRRWLYNCMDYQPFDKAVSYADQRRFDVGIIGLWYGRNYGSMATYYALHQVLTKKYHLSVLMIENPLKPDGEPTIQVARDFYDISKRRGLGDLGGLNMRCDTFIVGSDQLWNVWLSRPYKQMYYLEFVDEYKKRISYGTSFGIEYKGTEEEKLISGAQLRKFDHVSVRDDYTLETCEKVFGVKNVTKVLDPTLICPVEEYRAIEARSVMSESGPYILAYILDTNEDIGRQIEKLSILRKRKVVVLLDEPPWLWKDKYDRLKLSGKGYVEAKENVGLYEWLWFFSHAEAVVTDSFHGTIFSIINRKPFLTLSNARRGAQRFVSLLAPLELESRLFYEPSDIIENAKKLKELDYTRADALLARMQEESYAWLENALFSPKKVHCNAVYKIEDVRANDDVYKDKED